MSEATLHALSYSPWSERARWALDHHEVPYRFHAHSPYLGEPMLRWRAKAPAGTRASVPLFIDAHGIHRDSVDIMVHADRIGSRSKLVRDEGALRALAATAEVGLRAIRARVTTRILGDREALRESAMAAVPSALASLAVPVAAAGARFIGAKYAAPLGDEDANVEVIRTTAHALRAHVDLAVVPTPTSLRAEDIVIATFLQGVRPASVRHIPLRPALLRAWSVEPLFEELAPMFAWRDALYASARGTVRR